MKPSHSSAKALKIGFVLDDSLDKPDGVQQYILTLGRWLTEHGHEVHYLVGQTERVDILHVHSLSRNVSVRFNQNRLSVPLPANAEGIKNLLAMEGFDVLHVQMPFSPFLGKRIIENSLPGTAIIGTFHIVPFSWLETTAARLLSFWLQPAFKPFDRILSVSTAAQEFAEHIFKLQSDVLPNTVDLKHFAAGRPLRKYKDGKLTIVFLGRLVHRKGCGYLLQALDILRRADSLENVRVLVCGRGPLEPKLKRYAKKYELEKVVEFVGYVSEADKADYLASADIAVFPSVGGESFGIVLVEAMAAGAGVVLAGNNAGYRSVLSDNSLALLDPTDTVEFASRLQKIINNPGLRARIHAWQADLVHQYDINVVGSQLLTYYAQAIAKRHTPKDNSKQ